MMFTSTSTSACRKVCANVPVILFYSTIKSYRLNFTDMLRAQIFSQNCEIWSVWYSYVFCNSLCC